MKALGTVAYWGCIILGALGFGFFTFLALQHYIDGNSHDAANRAINAVTLATFAWLIGASLRSITGGEPFSLLLKNALGFYRLYVLLILAGGILWGVYLGLSSFFG